MSPSAECRTLALSVIFALLASCDRSKPPANSVDVCTAPKATAAETLADAQKDGMPNVTQADVDWINAYVRLDDCLAQRAFQARRLSGSMEETSRAVMAQCVDSFGSAEFRKDKLPYASKDAAQRTADRSDDQVEEAQTALAYVATFRECALGVSPP